MPTNQTINDVLPWTQAEALLNQVVFDTNWTAAYPSDIVVYKRGMNDAPDEINQVLEPEEFNVSFVGSGQTVRVTLLTPAAQGDIVTISRNTDVDRVNLYTNTNFVPSMLNQDTATLTLVDQERQMYEKLAVKYHLTGKNPNFAATDNPSVPDLGPNQIWASDSTGNKIIAMNVPSGGGFATDEASYITQTPHIGLPNAQAMNQLPTGFVTSQSDSGVQSTVNLIGVSRQTVVDGGDGSQGNVAIGLADNPIIPGTSGMGIPQGTTAERVTPAQGIGMRFNTDLQAIEIYVESEWVSIPSSAAGLFLSIAGGTMFGDIDMNDSRILQLPLPASANEPATKGYVDGLVLNLILACAYSTTASLAGYTYNNGVSGVGATLTAGANGALSVDGVVVAVNDRILVPYQTAALQNGVYVVTQAGNVSLPAILTRAPDYDNVAEMQAGDVVSVVGGATLAGSRWMMTQTAPITIGVTPITWLNTTLPSNLVTTNTAQNISGQKSFQDILLPALIKALNGATAFGLSSVNGAVNWIELINSIANGDVGIVARGSDANIPAKVESKGAAPIKIRSANSIPIRVESGTTFRHNTNLIIPDTSATRDVTLPDKSGTVSFLDDRGMVFLGDFTSNNAAFIGVGGITGYKSYRILYSNLVPTVSNSDLRLVVSSDGGATPVGSYNMQNVLFTSTVSGSTQSFGQTSFVISTGHGNTSSNYASGIIDLVNPSSLLPSFLCRSTYLRYDNSMGLYNSGGYVSGIVAPINSLRLFFSAGLTTASVQLYGIK